MTLGTVSSAKACTSLAPWRITPSRSCSCRAGSRACRRARAAACRTRCRSARSAPPSARPPRRARRRGGAAGWRRSRSRARRGGPNAQTMLRAQRGEISSSRPPSSSAARDVAHVVDLAPLGRDGRSGRGARGRDRRPAQRLLAAVLRQVVEQVARQQRGVDVGRRRQMADAVALVHAGAAERARVELLARSPPRRPPGPVRNMLARSVMITKSVSAGA